MRPGHTERHGGVGLVVALPDELRPVARRLGLRRDGPAWHGRVGRQRVVALLGGLGTRSAGEAAVRLLEGFGCHGLVTLGFAGALDPALRVAQVLAVETSRAQDDRLVPASAAWLGACRHAADLSGTCLTMLVPVRTPEEKAVLHEVTGAQVVDMETSAVAAVAAERGVPWAGLRAVTDAAGDTIPVVVQQRIQPERGRIDTPGMVLHVLPRPGHWPDLIALARRSRRASQRLAEAAQVFLEGL